MQFLSILICSLLLFSTARAETGNIIKPTGDRIPAWQKGIGGPFPVEKPQPVGLWALPGSDCHADNMSAIAIGPDTVTFFDPGARSGSFSPQTGSIEIVGLPAGISAITLVEPLRSGHRFTIELEDGSIDQFTFEVLGGSQARLTFAGGVELALTQCDKPEQR